MSNKVPWELYPDIWPTQSSWLSYVRGGIRRGLWEKYPPKLEFLNATVEMIENTNPRSKKRFPKVKMWKCEQCEKYFKSDSIQVDHRQGHNSLKSIEDIGGYVEAMLIDCSFADYALLCHPCHAIKSYQEAHGLSFEDASAIKQSIAIQKVKGADKKWLETRGIVAGSNAKTRREQLIKEFKKDYETEYKRGI